MSHKIIKLNAPTKYSGLLESLTDGLFGNHPLIDRTTDGDTKTNLIIIGEVTDDNLENLINKIGNDREMPKGMLFIADEINAHNNEQVLAKLASDTGRRVLSKPNDSELTIELENEKIICRIGASNSGSIPVPRPTFLLTMPNQEKMITTEKSDYVIDSNQYFGQFIDPEDYTPQPQFPPITLSSMITPSIRNALAGEEKSKYGDKGSTISSQPMYRR